MKPLLHDHGVSIHAPWEGCDSTYQHGHYPAGCFNSRTLGRVRRSLTRIDWTLSSFQFTHPGKGATKFNPFRLLAYQFQFTHPGKGATKQGTSMPAERVFQFTHPGKGATLSSYLRRKASPVSIHAPWEGCDAGLTRVRLWIIRFNSRTLGRVRHSCCRLYNDSHQFQFTHPGKGATWFALR